MKYNINKMIVCIAEKPSVARDIAHILGATTSYEGYLEGNGYQVTWTFGHLCELKSPEEYTSYWKRWDLWDLPLIPNRFGIRLKDDAGIQKQFKIIQKLFLTADSIINCGDAGQEGELIQRWVLKKTGAHCPVQRLWISSMTDEAIREGFRQLKDQSEYQRLYIAGLCRAIGDWLLGMNCTRLYTLKYGQNHQLLSVGRVQTPTLALIVHRQKEIENFIPEPYWILSTIYRETMFLSVKGKFSTEEEGIKYLEKVKYLPFTVVDVQTKSGKETPPQLYDLTSLQVDCNKKYGYTAEQTLQTIQSLYEKKFTTYPRVDTTYLPDDLYPKSMTILHGLRDYETLTSVLDGVKLPKRKKVFDTSKVTDHHAIIPTGQPASGLTMMEEKVYDLITRAYIAVFYPDCQFLTTTILGCVEDVDFKTSGKQITELGWRAIYVHSNTGTERTDGENQDVVESEESAHKTPSEEERLLPIFEKGEQGKHQPSLQKKTTQPPAYYTEATLLRAMETAGKLVDNEELREALKENGIGRPSTRASIIETLFKRCYIKRDGKRKRIIATSTGIELIEIIHEELLKSAELTGIWEKKLREIERGQYDAAKFIEELKQMVNEIIMQVRNDNSNRRITFTAEEDVKQKRTKVSNSTKTTNDRSNLVTGFQPRKQKQSTKTKSKVVQSEIKTTQPADEWVGLPCPICGIGYIIKGKTAYGCSRWKEGCNFRRPFN